MVDFHSTPPPLFLPILHHSPQVETHPPILALDLLLLNNLDLLHSDPPILPLLRFPLPLTPRPNRLLLPLHNPLLHSPIVHFDGIFDRRVYGLEFDAVLADHFGEGLG